ncbi:LSM domain-containing [Cryptosporidium sp. chipmunk genotype I]|uniref:LSM domain-containing n=1 Tax=Cryptosporidium sp. chipmunk genotype I TaxID=1280935 RepID=UPI00351A189E|nr:LSM domain-containing [Cryptosporidium sp. chipmunk genotype I]
MQKYINYRIRVTVQDDRVMVGNLMAFDRHMNLVLSDCQEYRQIKKGEESKELKRSLGLIMLRGENIVTFVAEAPPKNQSAKPVEPTFAGNIQTVTRGPLIPPIAPPGQFPLINPSIGGLPIPPPGIPPFPPNIHGNK